MNYDINYIKKIKQMMDDFCDSFPKQDMTNKTMPLNFDDFLSADITNQLYDAMIYNINKKINVIATQSRKLSDTLGEYISSISNAPIADTSKAIANLTSVLSDFLTSSILGDNKNKGGNSSSIIEDVSKNGSTSFENTDTLKNNNISSSSKVIGDVNNDGKVTSADARIILRYSSKLQELDGDALKNADINGDGKVTAADSRLALLLAAKLPNIPTLDMNGDGIVNEKDWEYVNSSLFKYNHDANIDGKIDSKDLEILKSQLKNALRLITINGIYTYPSANVNNIYSGELVEVLKDNLGSKASSGVKLVYAGNVQKNIDGTNYNFDVVEYRYNVSGEEREFLIYVKRSDFSGSTKGGIKKAFDSLYDITKNNPKFFSSLNEIYIYDNANPKDTYWKSFYGDSSFTSAATGGDSVISLYASGISTNDSQKGVEGTIIHELGHTLDNTNGKYELSTSREWANAAEADGGFPSDYALQAYNSYVRAGNTDSMYAEDFADSLRLYIIDRANFERKYPNRAKVLMGLINKFYK